ncbi:DUF805 domain-containing protein [Serratia marcescens]|uniref:DUF805 domain-containing protein n=1 Tax=Serratia marcescens TaxID=615 RepID=UPI003AFAEEC7
MPARLVSALSRRYRQQDEWISIFALAAFLLPLLAANVRRLHDAGYSGGWCLTWFCFTPYVMLIFALFLPAKNINNPYDDRQNLA